MTRALPAYCGWEITEQCDMGCKHCGSSCGQESRDELTTAEALSLIKQLGRMKLRWVSIMGGEPLLRRDWPLLCERLREVDIPVSIITNGARLNDETATEMKAAGVAQVMISLDGPRDVHDKIRRPGSYAQCERAVKALEKVGIQCIAATTLFRQNIGRLGEMKAELKRIGVKFWQFQIGLPMGNLAKHREMVISPEDISTVIDFADAQNQMGEIRIYLSDGIGYYSRKELSSRRFNAKDGIISVWSGCSAGIRGFGILSNGDINGCISMRQKEFLEGNVRTRSIEDIWSDENSFGWRRTMTKEKLGGQCGSCVYGERCLGGCPNSRLTNDGALYGENRYCVYNVECKK